MILGILVDGCFVVLVELIWFIVGLMFKFV